MPNDLYFDQQKRIAEARGKIMEVIGATEERDISIWIAALVETLKRFSDWNLEAERKQASDN